MPVPYHEPSFSSTPPSNSTTKWGPYSGAGDFGANMVVILVIIFCVLILVLAVNALIRYLLCAARAHHRSSRRQNDLEKGPKTPGLPATGEVGPTLIFSTGIELAGTAAECSICLAEFADGDRVRVLSPCNHGFHVSCIEKWLVAKKSCPTCRAICQVAVYVSTSGYV